MFYKKIAFLDTSMSIKNTQHNQEQINNFNIKSSLNTVTEILLLKLQTLKSHNRFQNKFLAL